MAGPDSPLAPGAIGLDIEQLRLLHGANYFSWEPVVWMRLRLGAYDEVFTDQIPGFGQRLTATLPSLYEHHCSPGHPGGFLQRVEQGTLLGHVVEHVAIELQQLAGMPVNFGKTRATATPGLYNVLFQFADDQAGLYAAHQAVLLINSLLKGEPFAVVPVVARLIEIREARLLGPSTQALVDAAARRGIPWLRLDGENLVQLGTGRYQQRLRATLTSRSSLIAYETALDKQLSLALLADAAVPVPQQLCSTDSAALGDYFASLGGPATVKPRQGVLGRGVTPRVDSAVELAAAVALAGAVTPDVVVQRHLSGASYRLLTIGHRLVAAVRLEPAAVTGDGQRRLGALIAALNADPRRGVGDKGALSQAVVDDITARLLAARGLTQDSVVPAGDRITLQISGAMKLGGSAIDVTDLVHADTRRLVERASRVIGLDVAGIDIIAQDIGQPLAAQGGAVIEVGAAPDFRPHLRPTLGSARPVADQLIDSLFPPGLAAHAITISITGGRGSAAAAAWLAACLGRRGQRVALASAAGLFSDAQRLSAADASQPEAARIALRDPDADHIVLQTALSGILRGGLGYDLADVGVVLNFVPRPAQSDAVRLDHDEDQAYAQSVVAEQVRPLGTAVLNADQHLVSEVRPRLQSPALWFSRSGLNRTLRAALRRGGRAVLLEHDQLSLLSGRRGVTPLGRLSAILGDAAADWQTDVVLALAATLIALEVEPDQVAPLLAATRASLAEAEEVEAD